MRKRVTTAALTVAAIAGLGVVAAPSASAAGSGDTAITKVVVNGNNKVAIGTTTAKTFTVSVTATDDSGIAGADFWLMGPSYGYAAPNAEVTCADSSATTATCSATFTIDPRVDFVDNSTAGTWYVDAWVDANDGDYFTSDKAGSFLMQRYAKLTANASPEPVGKGKTLTVSGTLTRASWASYKYWGYSGRSVQLQFRPAGSSTYSTVKTVTSGTDGALKTTVTASVDGYWRWSYGGNTTTSSAKASGDYVDVV